MATGNAFAQTGNLRALDDRGEQWVSLRFGTDLGAATAVPTKITQYGQTFEQVIPIAGVNGKTIDTMFVFMKDNSGTVRLITGIPARK
jgi:filamentous hemagglutinin